MSFPAEKKEMKQKKRGSYESEYDGSNYVGILEKPSERHYVLFSFIKLYINRYLSQAFTVSLNYAHSCTAVCRSYSC